MAGLEHCRLLALVVIFTKVLDEVRSSDVIVFHSVTPNSNSVVDKTKIDDDSSGGQPLPENADHAEVGSVKNHADGSLDYFVAGVTVGVKNGTGTKLAINKCCRWNYFFDVDEFACRPFVENSSESDILSEMLKNEKSESDYLFIERLPDCGNRSVVSARSTSRFSIGTAGVAIDGEGEFSEFCLDVRSERPPRAVILTCDDPATFCRTRPCFRKCCPLGYSYGPSERKCQKSDEAFRPKFYNLSSLTRVDSAKTSDYGIYLGDACGGKGKYLLERNLQEVSYLGLDGTLFAPGFDGKTFSDGEFCVEFVRAGNDSQVESFLCFSKGGVRFENSQLQFFLLSLGFVISCMFLLITFLIYLFSLKSRNLYGKTLMCYVACLFAAYLCLAVVALKSKEIDNSVCTNMGYSLLFAFLAAFFWLNVMSFDIWKTFRLDRNADRSKADKGNLRFFWYSMYAWSLPSAITAACAYANQASDFPYEAIKPDIGEENCWFSRKKKGIYVFFIAPISLVITFNLIFYVQTAWKIWKVKSDVKNMDRRKSKKFSANKEQFLINGKLFIVMGITWSLEIISFFVPHPVWYVTDAANALHGVFVFAVFVLKKKMLRQLSEQVRAPLKKIRQKIRASDSDDLSKRGDALGFNSGGRSSAAAPATTKEDSRK